MHSIFYQNSPHFRHHFGGNCGFADFLNYYYELQRNNRLSLINDKGIVNKEYDNFSLFAYLSSCKGVRIKGAYYTAGFYDKETIDINPNDQFAQSNFVSEDYAEISLDEGTLLLIESND